MTPMFSDTSGLPISFKFPQIFIIPNLLMWTPGSHLNIDFLWDSIATVPQRPYSHLQGPCFYHYLHQTKADVFVICSHRDLYIPSSSYFKKYFIKHIYLMLFSTNSGVEGKKLFGPCSLPLYPQHWGQCPAPRIGAQQLSVQWVNGAPFSYRKPERFRDK